MTRHTNLFSRRMSSEAVDKNTWRLQDSEPRLPSSNAALTVSRVGHPSITAQAHNPQPALPRLENQEAEL